MLLIVFICRAALVHVEQVFRAAFDMCAAIVLEAGGRGYSMIRI